MERHATPVRATRPGKQLSAGSASPREICSCSCRFSLQFAEQPRAMHFSAHCRVMPYFRRIVRTLSSGIAWTVRPRLVTEVAMNSEL